MCGVYVWCICVLCICVYMYTYIKFLTCGTADGNGMQCPDGYGGGGVEHNMGVVKGYTTLMSSVWPEWFPWGWTSVHPSGPQTCWSPP